MARQAAFTLVIVLTFFALLEGVLALTGVEPVATGRDPYVGFSARIPLFVEAHGSDPPAMVTATGKKRFFNEQAFPKDKPQSTFRVFCVGGSTTYGRPYSHETAFCGWLQAFLEEADSSRDWEVINAGGISYASYRVAVLMEELSAYEPDAFIIYTGHNEFLEHRTYGNLAEMPEWLRTLGGLLSQSRTFALLDRLLTRGDDPAPDSGDRTVLAAEVQTLLDGSVGPEAFTRDDAFQQEALAHYRFNLGRMVELARESGAMPVLITPASNLADCAPFKSQPGDGLTGTQVAAWERAIARAETAAAQGDADAARRAAREAVRLDPRQARGHYLHGRLLQEAGRHREAEAAFRRARDEDVCPLRALSPMAEIVRQVARAGQVPLVDFEALARQQSRHGIPGGDLFLDHVHPTVETHGELALALLDVLQAQGVLRPGPQWDDEAVAAVRRQVVGRIDDATRGRALRNLAKVLGWAGKFEEADELALRAADASPQDPNVQYLAGVAYERRGEPDLAMAHFRQALELDPAYADAHYGLGGVLLALGRAAEAEAALRATIRLQPDYVQAHTDLGVARAQQGDLRQAEAQFREALRIEPGFPGALNNLGILYAAEGRLAEAVVHYRQALEVQPDFAEAHNNLGIALARQGDIRAAAEQFARALELEPGYREARSNLRRAEHALQQQSGG